MRWVPPPPPRRFHATKTHCRTGRRRYCILDGGAIGGSQTGSAPAKPGMALRTRRTEREERQAHGGQPSRPLARKLLEARGILRKVDCKDIGRIPTYPLGQSDS